MTKNTEETLSLVCILSIRGKDRTQKNIKMKFFTKKNGSGNFPLFIGK